MMNLILVVFQCCTTQYQENAKHTPSHHLGPHSHHVHHSGEGKECIVLPSRGIPLYHTPHHSLHQQIVTGLTERHIKVSLYVKKIVFQLTHAWVMFFLANITAGLFYVILLYLAHQTHQQNHNLAGHRRPGWPPGTSHWRTETPLVGIEVWGWLVHRSLHLNGLHSLVDHCNAELVSNKVHCKVVSK